MIHDLAEKEKYMKRAIELAKTAVGHTSPNPLVGCVVVKNGRIVTEACHERCGQFHAERNALTRCNENLEGAELYVTLEPCCHYGKTPPCTDVIIERGIKKVYVGSLDSNPLVAGHGIEILRNHGIEVECGILEDECLKMNEIFYHFITTKTPFVACKYAMTLDGKIAAYTGDSKWISCQESRKQVHELRRKYSGILVGINTVLADNPMLNCRIEEGVDPVRIIMDSTLKIPMDCNIVNTAKDIPSIIVCTDDILNTETGKEKSDKLRAAGMDIISTGSGIKPDFRTLMEILGERKIDSILIEGGGMIHSAALNAGIVNKVYAYIAPKIIMGEKAKSPVGGAGISLMKDAIELTDTEMMTIGKDILITGYIRK